VRRVLRLVLWMNGAVVALKLAAFVSSRVLSVFAEAVHSSLDGMNNVFALWIARVAARAPDEDHPYGHQKSRRSARSCWWVSCRSRSSSCCSGR
jgi:divalent metal cation (Fe/Co/Zn/Cd) transporter